MHPLRADKAGSITAINDEHQKARFLIPETYIRNDKKKQCAAMYCNFGIRHKPNTNQQPCSFVIPSKVSVARNLAFNGC
jgi:hypothetical protein